MRESLRRRFEAIGRRAMEEAARVKCSKSEFVEGLEQIASDVEVSLMAARECAERSSDASTFDEICVLCGCTDEVPGGWGRLADPCSGLDDIKHRLKEHAAKGVYDQTKLELKPCESQAILKMLGAAWAV